MHGTNLSTNGMRWELPVQKRMIQMLRKLAELPITVVQHNSLFVRITIRTAGL